MKKSEVTNWFMCSQCEHVWGSGEPKAVCPKCSTENDSVGWIESQK